LQKTAGHDGVTIAAGPPQFAEQPFGALLMRQRSKWHAAADEDGPGRSSLFIVVKSVDIP
jgi:hypothetical protein